VIVGLAGELRGLRDIGAAMLTGAGGNLAILRGIWMQRPMRASVRLAALFGARAFVLARAEAEVFALARRRAGIVRSLFRQIQLGFEFATRRVKRSMSSACDKIRRISVSLSSESSVARSIGNVNQTAIRLSIA